MATPQIRVRIHQDILRTLLFHDLIAHQDIRHPKAVIDLTHVLLNQLGSTYSFNHLTQWLKSLGHSASKSIIADYINWMEDTYFLFTVRLYDASSMRSKVNPKKIYCIDHALAQSVQSGFLANSGHFLENLIFLALRRLSPTLFYYKTQTYKEVDFITPEWDPEWTSRQRWTLIQVCETIADPKTRHRELRALEEAMREMKIAHAFLVTRRDTEHIPTPAGSIEVIPTWRFLLNTANSELDCS